MQTYSKIPHYLCLSGLCKELTNSNVLMSVAEILVGQAGGRPPPPPPPPPSRKIDEFSEIVT
jgi:hypothetical protein